ncbi:MAG TPA: 50S ribosomal protein L20 [Ktedonobacterales bacterium]|nr:50S ribosomal protein L20 [Ktedonobacterales bacterium]
MPRVKRGVTSHKRHKKVLNYTEGHWGARSRLIKTAHESMMKSLAYAYRDRRNRKRDMRRLWITRINAAARMNNMRYNELIQGLQLAGVAVDRKIMADIAVADMPAFSALVAQARSALQSAAARA